MEGDKDVLDGWCLYEERNVGTSGSNSSDSESIEIISEDETGNYQIYSKKYFKPDSITTPETEQTNSMTDNNTSLVNTEEIAVYKENDPTHLTVEEGTEAREREDQVEKVSKVQSKPKIPKKYEIELIKCDIEPKKCEVEPIECKIEPTECKIEPKKCEIESIECKIEPKKCEIEPTTECEIKNLKTTKKSEKLRLVNEKATNKEEPKESNKSSKQQISQDLELLVEDDVMKEHEDTNSLSVIRIERSTSPGQHRSKQSTEDFVNAIYDDTIKSSQTYKTIDDSPKLILCEKQRIEEECKEKNIMLPRFKKETNYFNNLEFAARQIDHEYSNRNLTNETINENTTSDQSNCDITSCTKEIDFTQVKKRKRRKFPEKDTENNSNRSNNSEENLHNENLFLQNELNIKIECNLDQKDRQNNEKKFDFSNINYLDTPSTSSTDTEPIITVIKKRRNKHGDKKPKNNEEDINTEVQLNNLINNSTKNCTKDKTYQEINNLGTNITKDKSPDRNNLTNDNVIPPEPFDSRTLVLVSLVSSVLYLIYSTLFLSHTDSVVSSTFDTTVQTSTLDTIVQSVHNRYTQLVHDWESRVLENAELDYQIALKERSDKFQQERNTTWDSNRGHFDLFLPECLHDNILTHAFVHLRSYPPDIHDSCSWNKPKLCVDLTHIVSPMRSLSFSSVLRFLLFLLSPSSQLNYEILYEHYIYQQRIHIHNIIQTDYPEIYQRNAFYQPDSKPRPGMYCLSMSRFGVLRNKFTPDESDNMLALAKLSDLYVNNDNCLHTILKRDGSSLDHLYNMILDVLLTRSLSTAITLDPALLHDYYLELILSNETNLRKLSKQLFKYNMLAIDKFNLTLSNLNTNENKENIHRNKDKFHTFHGGDDVIVNREYVDKKEKQDDVKIDKHQRRSLSKTQIELFYDSQLREISNGYNSKVAKFLTDINSELKHALCFPYSNMGDNVKTNYEHEPLVRFIKTMCRTNVKQTQEENTRARENKQIKYNTQSRGVNQEELHDKLDQYNGNTIQDNIDQYNGNTIQDNIDKYNGNTIQDNIDQYNGNTIQNNIDKYNGNTKPLDSHAVETKQDELYQQEMTIESGDTKNWIFIPNGKRGTFGENIINTIPLELYKIETSIDEMDPLVNIEPDLEELRDGFEEELFIRKETDNDDDQQESAYENDYFEESLENGNIPDLWIMNQMAKKFGLVDNYEKPTAYHVNTEQYVDKIEVDDSETLIQEEIASFLEKNQKYKKQFETLKKENRKHKDGHKKDKRKERFVENTNNRDNTRYQRRSSDKNEANTFHTRYTDEYTNYEQNNHQNRKENDDTTRYKHHTDYLYKYNDNSWLNKEERIVHIDGNDNKYTRHVYIDNINVKEIHEPDDDRHTDTNNVREYLEPNDDGPSSSKNKRQKSKRGENPEMDFWSNRRARLRAKLRKKTSYPTQNNPDYHYDYVY